MRIIGDFHIHSKYSRATSPATDLENLDKWATIKGVDVLGTGDFTHPGWTSEIKEKLRPLENGLFGLKEKESKVRFLLTTEISCIYKKGGKVRKVHVVLFAPSLEVVEKINRKLAEVGNLNADGRPILGLDAKELLKIVLDADENCLVVPAHIGRLGFLFSGQSLDLILWKNVLTNMQNIFLPLRLDYHRIQK
jgi:PHP family Zn ribbon phosphoesterase